MEKSNLNSRREFLQKMLAATAVAGLYPYLECSVRRICQCHRKRQIADQAAWKDRTYGRDI